MLGHAQVLLQCVHRFTKSTSPRPYIASADAKFSAAPANYSISQRYSGNFGVVSCIVSLGLRYDRTGGARRHHFLFPERISYHHPHACGERATWQYRYFEVLCPPHLQASSALLITLAVAYGLTYCGLLSGQITLGGLTAQLLYFANYYTIYFDPGDTKVPGGTGVLWSLAVEEHFYIFFPLFMTLLVSNAWRPRTTAIVFVISCLLILAWRTYLVWSPEFVAIRTYLASDTQIDSIIYGCLMAVLINPLRVMRRSKYMSLPQWALFSIAGCLLLLSLIYRNPVFRETLRYSLQGIALLPIFYFAILFHDNVIFRHLNSVWAIRIGTYSYVIYLIHHVILSALDKNLPFTRNNFFFVFPLVLMISIAYAAAIDRFVDPYFRLLRQKYRSSKRSPILSRT